MKLRSLIIAAVVALPAVSFAQSNQPVTRAEVRAQLVELQQAGYNPASDQTQYPQNIQAALARIDAQRNVRANAYGAPADSASASGSPAKAKEIIGLGLVYAHS
ncbi:DUF4148 domain-containing protein [Paraburkholderia diazotrophica]|uniref:DUF4148 domain-containing protein n=1 Tax=Paraburkholderia diazotrophica TaxID=667676 RepID=A0A1H7EJE0_9BURK|nr:DUF4148 domain-containing protein [Paraburkholderia diazotrophica]SEK12152.1 protein of unknown function [Paraburkholderia diazotrophica]